MIHEAFDALHKLLSVEHHTTSTIVHFVPRHTILIPAISGWLLRYPMIYTTVSTAQSSTGTCLGNVPLALFEFMADVREADGLARTISIMSFSCPEELCESQLSEKVLGALKSGSQTFFHNIRAKRSLVTQPFIVI